MTIRTLLLNTWYFPHQVIRWEDAVTLLHLRKVDRVVDYTEELRSPSITMRAPAVVRLKRKIDRPKSGVRFSRINVFTRDRFRCQYCGKAFPMARLTYDHLIPRSRGGRTNWTNIVTACRPCNHRKGARTPDEAGMFPRQLPVRPKALAMTHPVVDVSSAPREWRDFLVVRA